MSGFLSSRDAALLRRLTEFGLNVSPTKLARWRRAGLIPRPAGRTRGFVPTDAIPEEEVEQAAACARLLAGGVRSLDEARVRLYAAGWELEHAKVAASFRRRAARVLERERAAATAKRKAPVPAERIARDLRRIGGDVGAVSVFDPETEEHRPSVSLYRAVRARALAGDPDVPEEARWLADVPAKLEAAPDERICRALRQVYVLYARAREDLLVRATIDYLCEPASPWWALLRPPPRTPDGAAPPLF
ncbi:MAG TPA: hypothetical protein VFA44_02885 [Gaiellaceae bacterium]|nr:hypothetical protein [Gaiellaceae bacterium]